MGTPASKPEAKPEPQSVVEEEKSSGFHILEVHAPTAGISVLSVFFFLLLFVGLIFVLRKFSKSGGPRRRQRRQRRRRFQYGDEDWEACRWDHPAVWNTHHPLGFQLPPGGPYRVKFAQSGQESRLHEVDSDGEPIITSVGRSARAVTPSRSLGAIGADRRPQPEPNSGEFDFHREEESGDDRDRLAEARDRLNISKWQTRV